MKIKLIMEKRNLTVDLESEKAELLFNAFALKLLGIEEGTAVAEIVSDTVLHKDHCTAEAPAIEQKLPDIATDQRISAPIREVIRQQEAVNETKNTREQECFEKGYKGFMYIRCPKCGEIKGFNAKKESRSFICVDCGIVTPFEEPLKRLYLNCECGRRFTYWTNMTEEMFDIPCIDCGKRAAEGQERPKGQTVKKYQAAVKKLPFAEGALRGRCIYG